MERPIGLNWMRLLDLTLPTVAENLALDEALIEAAEAGQLADEVLRLWESPDLAVVVGRASRVADEVRRDACAAAGVPVFRRASGGATVVIGPGCLMYAVLLDSARHPGLAMIEVAHQLVLGRLVAALQPLMPEIMFQGTSDLTWGDRKFSGNSLRCKRGHVLYHGTILYDFPLLCVPELLGTPPRQPDYRAGRSHDDFVTNLPLTAAQLRNALIETWEAHEPLVDWPRALTADLATRRYLSAEWNERL